MSASSLCCYPPLFTDGVWPNILNTLSQRPSAHTPPPINIQWPPHSRVMMRILRRHHLQKIQNDKSDNQKKANAQKKIQNKINNTANSINQSRPHSSSFSTLNNSSQPNILRTGAPIHTQTQTHSDADKRTMASCTYSHLANTKSLVSTHKTRIKPASSFCPRAIFPTSCQSHQHHIQHQPQDPITYTDKSVFDDKHTPIRQPVTGRCQSSQSA